ncbi:ribonuclease H-like domain-containing protein [Tanacetum coccineum]
MITTAHSGLGLLLTEVPFDCGTDIILTASSLVLLQQIVDSLHKEFDMTDLGGAALCCSQTYPADMFHGILELGLQLYASATTFLVGYIDADWAGCPSTRSAVYMSANPVHHQRTKHIEIDIHFVRDMVKAGHVRVLHVPSRFQYADIFTKFKSNGFGFKRLCFCGFSNYLFFVTVIRDEAMGLSMVPLKFCCVNLQSGEVVVGGKRQKVQRRRRREVEHEEDPPSSPPNPQVLLMTRVEPSITRASSQMNDIDNHTSARNAFNINQHESSSYEYQQSMVLKGITPVAVRTSQESHTRVTNIMYNHVPTDAVTATITNYADEMHSTHSNSGKTPPSVQHQLIDQQQIKGRTQMALPRDAKDYYLLDTLKQHLMRPTTAMLPTLHLQQIPNTLFAGIGTHAGTPFTYRVPVDANQGYPTVLIHSVEDRNVTNIDGKYRGSELGVLLKFHILKLLKNTQVVSEEKRLSVLQPGFFKQRYVTRYTLPLTGSSSLSVQVTLQFVSPKTMLSQYSHKRVGIVRHPTGLFLSQKKYARQLLERAHMVNCNPSRTPIDTDSKLGPDGVPVQDPTLYRSLAGGLQYLTFTRPDLSYAVQQVCLYMHDPREPHFAALKRILRYVQGTLELGLQLYASATTSLVGYTDADWAGCPSTRRSTSGYCVFLGDNLLSWSAKRQHTISRSSAEAEYRGVANVVAETAWIRNLLRELHSPLLTATLVYCDNVSAVYMSANPVQHQRTKHIEIDIHFVRDMVKAGHVRVLHVPSRFQYADIFTKGLPSALFEDFRSSLSVRPPPAPTAGAY